MANFRAIRMGHCCSRLQCNDDNIDSDDNDTVDIGDRDDDDDEQLQNANI